MNQTNQPLDTVNANANPGTHAAGTHPSAGTHAAGDAEHAPAVTQLVAQPADQPIEQHMAQPAHAEPRYKLSISDGVVEKISSLAARKVAGIVDMKGNVFSLIQETFGGDAKSKGVNADVTDNGETHIELSIILEYGQSAVEVFEGLKKIVGEDIAHMTGLHIASLTVNVVDVMSEREIAEKRRKDENDANRSSADAG